jgi:tetratricopeptide (TPR) repeat protein
MDFRAGLPAEWLKLAPTPKPLARDQRWHVFVSYRSVNRIWVLNLYDVLRAQGYEVFVDQTALKPSDLLRARLEEALQASASGILVWSAAAAESGWVQIEYDGLEQRATTPGFIFVPIMLDGHDLPLFAKGHIYCDFSSYPDGPNGGELLRLLFALNGKPMSQEAVRFAAEQDDAAQVAGAHVGAAIRNGNAQRLVELHGAGGLAWETSSALGCRAAHGLIKLGHPAQAIAMLEELERRFPRAIRPKQLHALALARRAGPDDLERAQDILGALCERGERDPETLGIYGRTWMDRYARSGEKNDLRQSRDLYAEAFDYAPDDYYTGINAAAKSVFLDDRKEAARYAGAVRELVGTSAKPGDYWLTATVAEVLLIEEKYAEAGAMYEAAVATAPKEADSHRSTWTQACRLMAHLQPSAEDRAAIRKAFAHLPDCEALVA